MAARPAVTHFDEHNTAAILHDQVYFSEPAVKIALQNPEPMTVQVHFSLALPLLAVPGRFQGPAGASRSTGRPR